MKFNLGLKEGYKKSKCKRTPELMNHVAYDIINWLICIEFLNHNRLETGTQWL